MKLKITSENGFYNNKVTKSYTELQYGKMPHIVLEILKNQTEFGTHPSILNQKLLQEKPDLAVDEYGESVSLPLLLRDFKNSGIITYRSSYIVLTDLGRTFLKENVKKIEK